MWIPLCHSTPVGNNMAALALSSKLYTCEQVKTMLKTFFSKGLKGPKVYKKYTLPVFVLFCFVFVTTSAVSVSGTLTINIQPPTLLFSPLRNLLSVQLAFHFLEDNSVMFFLLSFCMDHQDSLQQAAEWFPCTVNDCVSCLSAASIFRSHAGRW